jgi:O-glycosyl hydrolase
MKKGTLSSMLSALLVLCCSGCQSSGDNTLTTVPDATPQNAITKETTDDSPMVIVVDPANASTTNNGVFEGWGTSLCWWANRIGYSDSLSQQAAELFYGEDGLRLNIMRYNIGGGDDPTHTHITRTDSSIPGWLVWDEATGEATYDYDADYNQLNVLKRCVAAAGSDAMVEVFSNSPPYFMTKSGCSSGGEDANETNLKADCFDDFANYLVTVTKYMEEELGIPVVSLSPMNEPYTDYWSANSWKQEGCHISPGTDQSNLITAVSQAMEKQDLTDVIIAASDETSPDRQLFSYNTYSEEAKSVIGRINTHTYGTNGIDRLGALAKQEGFNLWMSEVDGGDVAGTYAGQMGSALWIGNKIISDMNALSPSAWVMWQVIDNHISQNGYNGNQDSGMVNIEGGFWGACVCDHDKENIILTQKYYGIGQFTRYIRPGDTIIHCGENALGAYNQENNTLTIVVINLSNKEKTCSFDLSAFTSIGSSATPIRTSGTLSNGESWAELEPIATTDTGFQAQLKGNSITTYVIKDCVL